MRIGIISNCQVYGLVNSFSVLLKDGKAVGIPVSRVEDEFRVVKDCDIVYVPGDFRERIPDEIWNRLKDRVRPIPYIFFDAYHPDMTYARYRGEPLKGCLDSYHSLICICAWKAGMTPNEAVRLFNGRTYKVLGYLDGWGEAAANLLSTFGDNDIDLRDRFIAWARREPFMHTYDHPKVYCLYDIARAAMDRDGIPRHDYAYCPVHDNLQQGVHFPAYPEIAERYGVRGSYTFKRFHEYRTMDLEDFVRESFEAYKGLDPEALLVSSFRRRTHDRLMEILKDGV